MLMARSQRAHGSGMTWISTVAGIAWDDARKVDNTSEKYHPTRNATIPLDLFAVTARLQANHNCFLGKKKLPS